ncbi:hypothetical protein C7974DRAFT_447218 [Boeremia exigua]|uniref:uncharacterized protein n=1 Tax=Boeremia exigua TaxID=749465 RepID=UPI001E8D0416|nr:uncharacterized protein C7974DRAFT_447218 [Boeremia exigua]KAH6642602.1 hypothetical protein C7974DRAFT_447218 [Boeremia exigua]
MHFLWSTFFGLRPGSSPSHLAMPEFSQFYSATEAEAAANLRLLFTRETRAAPLFSSDDAEQLTNLLNGVTASTARPRNDANQPFFRTVPPVQSIEQLLNVSAFNVTQEEVHREKHLHYESTSEDSESWKLRSRTPSSDEPSPQKYQIPLPTSSVKIEASNTSNGSDDELPHMIEPTSDTHSKGWATTPKYHATYPRNVLQTMDTQFSKWSYDLNEGTTAIPFVMAQAPTDTHERLASVDRELWSADAEDVTRDVGDCQTIAKSLIKRVQKMASNDTSSSKALRGANHDSSVKADSLPRDGSTSKRAALIAKSKAVKDSSLVASKSVNQRRSALHKNRNRKSIMSSPPPTSTQVEPAQKPEPQAEQAKSKMVLLNSNEERQRRDFDSALQTRRIDFEDRHHLEALMEQLGNPMNTANKGRVVKDVDKTNLKEGEARQTGRLKGKARKKGKSSVAR